MNYRDFIEGYSNYLQVAFLSNGRYCVKPVHESFCYTDEEYFYNAVFCSDKLHFYVTNLTTFIENAYTVVVYSNAQRCVLFREVSLAQVLPNINAALCYSFAGFFFYMRADHENHRVYINEVETRGQLPTPFQFFNWNLITATCGKHFYLIGAHSSALCYDIYHLEMTAEIRRDGVANVVVTSTQVFKGENNVVEGVPTRTGEKAIYDQQSNRIIFFGGVYSCSPALVPMNILYSFDLTRKCAEILITKSENYPIPRERYSISVHGRNVYLAGGTMCEQFMEKRFNFLDVWRLNLDTLEWRLNHSSIPYGVCDHNSAVSSSGLLMFSGGHNTTINGFPVILGKQSCVIEPPSLKMACLFKLQSIRPDFFVREDFSSLTSKNANELLYRFLHFQRRPTLEEQFRSFRI